MNVFKNQGALFCKGKMEGTVPLAYGPMSGTKSRVFELSAFSFLLWSYRQLSLGNFALFTRSSCLLFSLLTPPLNKNECERERAWMCVSECECECDRVSECVCVCVYRNNTRYILSGSANSLLLSISLEKVVMKICFCSLLDLFLLLLLQQLSLQKKKKVLYCSPAFFKKGEKIPQNLLKNLSSGLRTQSEKLPCTWAS